MLQKHILEVEMRRCGEELRQSHSKVEALEKELKTMVQAERLSCIVGPQDAAIFLCQTTMGRSEQTPWTWCDLTNRLGLSRLVPSTQSYISSKYSAMMNYDVDMS
ncbi:unnamed protein product [Cladocopium goreaui]|uniref:Uncharacterized protein n=1 Tax=Cladocopium goreaui TaxID=2562237 RepID=A0A9P1FJN2_9DINO|nr:unnamed protein product [Cladocopium goreaui]